MARFVSCTVLDELKQLFVALCITSLAKKNYPEIDKYFQKLDNAIGLSNDKFDIDLEYLEGLDEELDNTLGDSNTYKNRSPFGIYFQSELNKCTQYITELNIKKRTQHCKENIHFLPSLPTFLATHYIPICPLRSGIILGPSLFPNNARVTSTNAVAENWTRIVKLVYYRTNPN